MERLSGLFIVPLWVAYAFFVTRKTSPRQNYSKEVVTFLLPFFSPLFLLLSLFSAPVLLIDARQLTVIP